ncbi:MAG: diaminopimelate epimerase [Gammaproteobacteria bacterium]|jgi:diaminopimelate epimerase
MLIPFTKMHGIGNDFVLIDNRSGDLKLSSDVVRRLADRRFGIGCDQVLVAAQPRTAAADVAMQIYNTDGSNAGQCGNGLRCFSVFMRDAGAIPGAEAHIETPGGLVRTQIMASGIVRATMGDPPELDPERVPMLDHAQAPEYTLMIEGAPVALGAVSMGNPHAVVNVCSVESAPVTTLGPAIQASSVFPAGVNVGFMQVLSPQEIRLRVFERGVGETLACGSGACAAVVVGQIQGKLGPRVQVNLPGGALDIEWQGPGFPVIMSGPTAFVFKSEVQV